MEPVEKDVKEGVLDSEIAKFLSITLAQENLSPAAKEKLTNLKTQYGLQSDRPGGGKAPPRPPKGGMPTPAMAANEDQEGASEELYDDVAGVISDDQYYSPMAPGGEGESTAENTATAGELNYELMSEGAETTNTASQGDVAGGDYMAMDDDTTQDVQEDYEEPQQMAQDEQASAVQDADYEMPGADTDYEVADKPSSMDNAPAESDNMYEGVEVVDDNVATTGSVDGVPMTGKERSGTFNLESLTKNTKPENIEGVIKKGFLNKQRKDGKKFIGSKYQKRYCVVRNHVLYYFKEKKSSRQQGYILLSGYKVAAANKKGREFTLTHPEGLRPFQFETISKKETEEWMSAIQAAADAPGLEDHNLKELRNKQPSDDESSLHYERSGMEKPEETVEDEEDMYDDTKEDLYEEVGAVQSTISSQQSSPPIEYEVSGPVATSPEPAEPSAAEPAVDEDYEVAEQTPAPPPPRPVKTQPPPPHNDTAPAVPPPRPTKQQPVQDDTYEDADIPGGAADFPPPPADDVVLEDYEELDTFQASVPASEPPPASSPAAVPAPVPAPVPARPPRSKPQAPATEPKPDSADDGDVAKGKMGCCCGRKIKSRNAFSCTAEGGKRPRCPCARSGRLCAAECKCRFCMNTQGGEKVQQISRCRCGEEKYNRTKDTAFMSCIDEEGKRRTKCPCYSGREGCGETCRCFNCKNSFGATNRPFKIPKPKRTGVKEPKIIGCRCGEERKSEDPGFLACVDVQGKRATRCPCFRAGVACEEYCKCFNCQNRFSVTSDADGIPLPKRFCTVAILESDAEYSL